MVLSSLRHSRATKRVVLPGTTAAAALLLAAGFWTKTSADYSRKVMAAWAVTAPTLLWAWRAGLRI